MLFRSDDATKSIEVILEALCAAIIEGLEERKVEKIDSAPEEEEEQTPARRERKAKAIKKETISKQDEEALNANVASKFAKSDEE